MIYNLFWKETFYASFIHKGHAQLFLELILTKYPWTTPEEFSIREAKS